MLRIIEKTKIWFSISLIIILIGFGFAATKGLEYGIDFKGGTVVKIDIGKDFVKSDVDKVVAKYAQDYQTNKSDNTKIEIKSNSITDNQIAAMFKDIKAKYNLKDTALISQDRIGATVGNELKQKAVMAIILSGIAMLIYVGIRFEFKFATAAILSLLHDVLITTAVYAVFRFPIDSGFLAAILTVIGYSINDTIVVFDRIRENSKYMRKSDVVEIANASLTQTMARSINTVLTVLITLIAVYAFVPAIRNFATPLLVGIISGMYSSIFIATPFWVIFKKKAKKKRAIA